MKLKKALQFKKSFYAIQEDVIKNGNLADNDKKLNHTVYGVNDKDLIKTYKNSKAIFDANQPNAEAKSNAQIDNFSLNRDLSDTHMKIMYYYEQVLKPVFYKLVNLSTK